MANPWVEGGMKSYIESVVRLEPNPSASSRPSEFRSDDQPEDNDSVAVGTLNICFVTRRIQATHTSNLPTYIATVYPTVIP